MNHITSQSKPSTDNLHRYWALFPIIPLLMVLSFGTASSTFADELLETDKVKEIDQLFEPYTGDDRPGASIAVIQKGHMVYAKGYGMANLEYDIPNKPETIFHIASVSKQFTSFAILLLADEGKLSLDDDIRKHLPYIRDFGHTIALRHLMNHTSGFRDQWQLLQMAEIRMDDVIGMDHLRRFLARQRELNFEPGSEYEYSNSGYTLLAEVVSRVSGMSFKDFCHERIFKPLGMHQSHFHDNQRHIIPGRAYSYRPMSGGYGKEGLAYANVGATSLMTTVNDMALWMKNLKTGEVGGTRVRDRLRERGKLSDGSFISSGFGLFHSEYKGTSLISHDGSDAGFRSYVAWAPEPDIGVIVFCNRRDMNAVRLGNRILDLFIAEESEMSKGPSTKSNGNDEADPIEIKQNDITLSEDILKTFEGHYLFVDSGEVISMRVRGKGLWGTMNGRWNSLLPVDNHIFRADNHDWKYSFENPAEGDYQVIRRINNKDEIEMGERILDETWHSFLQERVGHYYSPELEKSYRIVVRNDQLEFIMPRFSNFELIRAAGNEFNQAGNFVFHKIVFEQDASGIVTGFRVSSSGGRVHNLLFERVN